MLLALSALAVAITASSGPRVANIDGNLVMTIDDAADV